MIRTMWLSGVCVHDRWNSGHTMVSGALGRGLTNGYLPYKGTGVSASLPNIGGNSYPAGNGSGGSVDIYDLMDDNFDHTGQNFIGGSEIGAGGYLGGGPGDITFAGGSSSANMGGTFKATQKDKYLPSKLSLGPTPFAHDLPTTDSNVAIDPPHTAAYSYPVARLTYH